MESRIYFKINEMEGSGLKINFFKPADFLNFKNERFEVTDDIKIKGEFIKSEENIFFEGEVQASLRMSCGRCLEKFNNNIVVEIKEKYKPEIHNKPDRQKLSYEDTNYAAYSNEAVDILPVIMDQILLSVPIKPLCSDECKGLCTNCGIDLNKEICSCETNYIDPRLDVLKKIKNDFFRNA